MNASYILKVENKAQNIFNRICTFSRLYILSFIKQNASVFEGLSRAAAPFGGSLLPGSR